MRAFAICVLFAAGCQAWNAPYEKNTRTVEGCNEAVGRLRKCCPNWDTYLSCSYEPNTVGGVDVSPGQSQCIVGKTCDEIAAAVSAGKSLCGLSVSSRNCR
jgi:hypothetical protein